MKSLLLNAVITAGFIIVLASSSLSAEPQFNSIPIVGLRINSSFVPHFGGIRTDQICDLMWRHIQGTHGWDWANDYDFRQFLTKCDETGMMLVYAPSDLEQYMVAAAGNRKNWFRNPEELFTSDDAYAQASINYDSLQQTSSASDMYSDWTYGIYPINEFVAGKMDDFKCLWFYYIFDEAPSRQRTRMIEDEEEYSIYFPNLYTQEWANTVPPVPALSEVESTGLFSWIKYIAEHDDDFPVTTTLNFSLLHTILPGEYTDFGGIDNGTFARQAISVEAVCNAIYQGPPIGGVPQPPEDNPPAFICFDYYPFRYVNQNNSSSTTMCDDDWLFLIDHFEEGIDSTIVPALENDVPTFYFPQAFGAAGGPLVLTDSTLHYKSYTYRKPAPQEFLMLCNIALLHQAKGIFPYNLRSYIQSPNNLADVNNFISSSLLDYNLIPFDAPYEEYVYTNRWPKDNEEYIYQSVTHLPPWNAGFDPLYNLPTPPVKSPDPKYNEYYNEWLFKPHGDLFNKLERIFTQILRIGPEMYDLFWCDGYSDQASIATTLSSIPIHFVLPRIKVFENPAQNKYYLFYVNRFCRAESTPYEISFNSSDLPYWAACSNRLLDHSRRFVMDGTEGPTGTFTFLDTLGPGEARLVELVDFSTPIPADVRITDNNVWTILPARGDTATVDMTAVPGESVHIIARYYNMGTGGKMRIQVNLYDATTEETIGSSEINFTGLTHGSGNCRESEYRDVVFEWEPDTDDIGPHMLEARATPWIGEPDRADNTARMTFLIEPNDWATKVREDPWDMTEAASSPPPAWYTDDISSMVGWTTAYTDSISGMFEGSVSSSHLADNKMYLDMDGEVIDGDSYHFLSLIGKTEDDCDVYLGWKDINNITGEEEIGTLDSDWGRMEVFDLSTEWQGRRITEIWLSFRPDGNEQMPVRIGWVKLENGEL